MFFTDIIPIDILEILKNEITWMNRERITTNHILTWVIMENRTVLFINRDNMVHITDSVLKSFNVTPKYVIIDNINEQSYLL